MSIKTRLDKIEKVDNEDFTIRIVRTYIENSETVENIEMVLYFQKGVLTKVDHFDDKGVYYETTLA